MEALINFGDFNGKSPYVESFTSNSFDRGREDVSKRLASGEVAIVQVTEAEIEYFRTVPEESDIYYMSDRTEGPRFAH